MEGCRVNAAAWRVECGGMLCGGLSGGLRCGGRPASMWASGRWKEFPVSDYSVVFRIVAVSSLTSWWKSRTASCASFSFAFSLPHDQIRVQHDQ